MTGILELMAAGVYLHIPFCRSRCSYCDFATDVYRGGDAIERYVAAICKGIAATSTTSAPAGATPDQGGEFRADTIYFGGGTPSLLAAEQIEKILRSVQNVFDISPEAEITMEMNPATVTLQTLRDYKTLGINRASFGVQTFND